MEDLFRDVVKEALVEFFEDNPEVFMPEGQEILGQLIKLNEQLSYLANLIFVFIAVILAIALIRFVYSVLIDYFIPFD